MATDKSFIDHLTAIVREDVGLSARKMFGEYGVYAQDKLVALACDNQLFVKPTEAGRALLGEPVEASPYPGAKAHFLIDEGLDDPDALSALLAATRDALPAPKPKKPKKRQAD